MSIFSRAMTPVRALSSGNRLHREPIAVFIHVPKTGGTSLRQWLVTFFDGEVFVHKSRRRTEVGQNKAVVNRGIETSFEPTIGDIRDRFSSGGVAHLERYRSIVGHFTFDYPFVRALADRAVIISLVRDPLDRVISKYNWARLHTNHALHNCVQGKTLFQSLSTEGAFLAACTNMQLRAILGSRRTNRTWTIACNYRRMDLLTERMGTLYNRPNVTLHHRQKTDPIYREEVKSQPDFSQAASLIRLLNADEFEFVKSVGDMAEFNRT
jgi:hypothetical protein